MAKFQYSVLTFSILFFVACLFFGKSQLKNNGSRQLGVSSRDAIMQIRLGAIEQAKNSGQSQYEFESIVAPPLM